MKYTNCRNSQMEEGESSLYDAGLSLPGSDPLPLHAKRIVERHRESCGMGARVRVTGAEMSDIYRAYYGRFQRSYWRPQDNERVCNDAMEMLDQIVIFRGCEPTVIISYVALVREVYLHACTNLKGKNISLQERKAKMLEHWKQIENHFAKIKYAMLDCWPVGNETDLMAIYVSIALLYSFYKEVCDESIIRECYEAAERARRCGRGSLSESQFGEVQQYCDTIENIFFLRSTLHGDTSHSVNNTDAGNVSLGGDQLLFPVHNGAEEAGCGSMLGRMKDGPALLAEYGKLTTAGKVPVDEQLPHKLTSPSILALKNDRTGVKQQKFTDLPEYEAILSTAANGEAVFPRPSTLKSSRNLRNSDSATFDSKAGDLDLKAKDPKLSGLKPKVSSGHPNSDTFSTLESSSNTSDSFRKVSDSSGTSSPYSEKVDIMTTVNICDNGEPHPSTSSHIDDSAHSVSIVQIPGQSGKRGCLKMDLVSRRLDTFVNELVEEIIHTVLEMENESSGKRSRRNSETIRKLDTVQSTVLTSSTDFVPRQGTIVAINDESQEVLAEINKNVSIRAKRILKKNIDQQTEDIFIPYEAKVSTADKDADSGSDREGTSSKCSKPKLVVIEGYAEMKLNDGMPKHFYDLHEASFQQVLSDSVPVCSTESRIRTVSAAIVPESITTIILSTSAEERKEDGKKTETEYLIDTLEELSDKTENVQKLFRDEGEIQTYVVLEHNNEDKTGSCEESDKEFEKILKTLQKIEQSKQQHKLVHATIPHASEVADVNGSKSEMIAAEDGAVTKPIPAAIVATDKHVREIQTPDGNWTAPHSELEQLTDRKRKCTVTETKLPESDGKVLRGTVISVSNEKIPEITETVVKIVPSKDKADARDLPLGSQMGSRKKPYWAQKQKKEMEVVSTRNSQEWMNSLEDAPMQKLYYTSDLPYVGVTPKVIKQLLTTLEKFDARQDKLKNESSDEALIQRYANFEPVTCSLQRAREFDAQPFCEPLISSYPLASMKLPCASRPLIQGVSVDELVAVDQSTVQEHVPESLNKQPRESRDMSDIPGSDNIHGVQNEFTAQDFSKQLEHVSPRHEMMSLASPQLKMPEKQENTSLSLGYKPEIKELEIRKGITSKQKSPTEQSTKLKMKPILRKTFAKTEALSTMNKNNRQHELVSQNIPLVPPELRQHSSGAEMPPSVPLKLQGTKQEIGNDVAHPLISPTHHCIPRTLQQSSPPEQPLAFSVVTKTPHQSEFLKPQLQLNAARKTVALPDDEVDIRATCSSEINQANTSKQIEVLDRPETILLLKKTSELDKQPLEFGLTATAALSKGGTSTLRTADLRNVANESSIERGNLESSENTDVSKGPSSGATVTTETSEELIQIPHFDAKADFEKRFSGKNSRRGEVPIIVKSVNLRPSSEKRFSKHSVEDSLILSTSKFSASEKPDFNFIIKKDYDGNGGGDNSHENSDARGLCKINLVMKNQTNVKL